MTLVTPGSAETALQVAPQAQLPSAARAQRYVEAESNDRRQSSNPGQRQQCIVGCNAGPRAQHGTDTQHGGKIHQHQGEPDQRRAAQTAIGEPGKFMINGLSKAAPMS